LYALFGFSYAQYFVNQIEVPVGRGKPPVLIEKDESLDKVNFSCNKVVMNEIKFVVGYEQGILACSFIIILASQEYNGSPYIKSFPNSYCKVNDNDSFTYLLLFLCLLV